MVAFDGETCEATISQSGDAPSTSSNAQALDHLGPHATEYVRKSGYKCITRICTEQSSSLVFTRGTFFLLSSSTHHPQEHRNGIPLANPTSYSKRLFSQASDTPLPPLPRATLSFPMPVHNTVMRRSSPSDDKQHATHVSIVGLILTAVALSLVAAAFIGRALRRRIRAKRAQRRPSPLRPLHAGQSGMWEIDSGPPKGWKSFDVPDASFSNDKDCYNPYLESLEYEVREKEMYATFIDAHGGLSPTPFSPVHTSTNIVYPERAPTRDTQPSPRRSAFSPIPDDDDDQAFTTAILRGFPTPPGMAASPMGAARPLSPERDPKSRQSP
ncbi:hypothetical protein HGRIS_003812 [Hohenbuehelia grisea]|uniref:Uncharacterized protein n=1 Tax=Hohenbuehelia grisea TaxID=104357 RepID=A0ABR3JIB7_9AGAR